MFVAEIGMGRHIVGILRCVDTLSSPLLLPERYCYVSSAYVAPAQRKQGVLRALLAAAEAWCAARGIGEMRLHNSATSAGAAQAWDALGFEVVEHVRRRALVAPTAPRPVTREHVEAT
jgi:GNAT superfamily N-acetyltransferase